MSPSTSLGRRAFILAGIAAIGSACASTSLAVTSRSYLPVADVKSAVDQTAASVAPLRSSRTLDVPLYRQKLALSCEAASLRMSLAYKGIATTEASILSLVGADTRGPYFEDAVLRWGDPYATFVGDVNGSEVLLTGYGTYYPTIAAAAARLGAVVLAGGQGIAPDALYAYILAGHPAVAWVTYEWVAATRSDYTAFDGTGIPYAGPVEHAVAIAGVSAANVLINDPDAGQYWIPKATFEAAYATYNQMAVVVL